MLAFRHISEVFVDALEYLVKPPLGIQLPWWPTFSELTGGLRPNELTLISAPTGSGKTQWLADLLAQLLILQIPTFCAPVETGDFDFVIRALEGLDRKVLNDGEPKSVELVQRLHEKYADMMGRYPVYLSTHDNRVEIEEMLLTLRFMHETHGVKIAILDNLNFFLKVTGANMERAEMDEAMHSFVMLAKQIPMHVILVVHPRKTDHGRVVSEFDIKGSATAVQEASNVMLFNRAPEKDLEERKRNWSERELIFRKLRKRGVNVGKRLWFDYQSGRYEEAVE